MRACLTMLGAVLLLSACGGKPASTSPAAAAPTGAQQSRETASTESMAAGSGTASGAPTSVSSQGTFEGRTGELVNPDNSTMVFLYYDLAGIPPPMDNWVEGDSRVQYAPGPEKAANRKTVKAELESAAASVHGIGVLHLSMSANLSDYDPTYGEFTVQALSPSQEVEFQALGQKVSLRFANGRVAQIWKVPAAESQAIRDKIGRSRNVSMDVTLNILGVLPAPGGGVISTNVVDYELRDNQSGSVLARVQVPQ
ncbi:MAG: hypothetical protein R3F24_06525 [Gammaproteobacteria bacterium]